MGEQTVEAEDWRERLAASLEGLRRLAVLGIGNELYGDDGAGVALARLLAQSGIAPGMMQAFEAGPAPENFTGSLRKFMPSHVLMVDAANLGLEPGSTRSPGPASAPTPCPCTYWPIILPGKDAGLSCSASNPGIFLSERA